MFDAQSAAMNLSIFNFASVMIATIIESNRKTYAVFPVL